LKTGGWQFFHQRLVADGFSIDDSCWFWLSWLQAVRFEDADRCGG
jgi:hypothetical protein